MERTEVLVRWEEVRCGDKIPDLALVVTEKDAESHPLFRPLSPKPLFPSFVSLLLLPPLSPSPPSVSRAAEGTRLLVVLYEAGGCVFTEATLQSMRVTADKVRCGERRRMGRGERRGEWEE